MIEIKCSSCNNTYERWPYEIKGYVDVNKYVCRNCKSGCNITKTCKHCTKAFVSRKKENKQFCSQSCSATYNNKKRDKAFYKNNKVKLARCKNCKQEIYVNIRSCSLNVFCKKCKQKHINQRQNEYNRRLLAGEITKSRGTRGSCKIHIKTCNGCKKPFITANAKRNLDRKTCCKQCTSLASNGIRTYQNGSRKPSWYFCKEQKKNVLLESSWEVETAKLLDELKIKWIRPEPLEWFDENNKKRFYYPDFYLLTQQVYLDPKNPFCLQRDKNKLQYFKNKRLPLIVGDLNVIKKYLNEGCGVTVSITDCDSVGEGSSPFNPPPQIS